jgi:hypothetical protein
MDQEIRMRLRWIRHYEKTVTAAILVHDGKILIAKRGPRDN